MLLFLPAALAWTCPPPPDPHVTQESVARRGLVLQMIGSMGRADGTNVAADILPDSAYDGDAHPWWASEVENLPWEIKWMREGALDTLHGDDRAWFDAYVASARPTRDVAAAEACIAERGLTEVRRTFGPSDAALGAWFAAEAVRAGRLDDAI